MQGSKENHKYKLKFFMRTTFCFLSAFLIFLYFSAPCFSASLTDNYPQIAKIEKILFGKAFPDLKLSDRLTQIEKDLFTKSYPVDSLDKRTERVKGAVLGNSEKSDNNYEGDIDDSNDISDDKPNQKLTNFANAVSDNTQAKEVDPSQFLELLVQNINEERSFKGLLPVQKDLIAKKVSDEHSHDVLQKGYLSYFNLKQQTPDERYTLAGGTGATVEIIKGFQVDDKKIKLTDLLARQLIQAIVVNPDDLQVIYNPYITHVGCGFVLSSDKKKFVAVIEFVTKGGEFEPLKPVLNFGEKVSISGRVDRPYKFKAVSIAYFNEPGSKEIEYAAGNFDNESLKPYFPPQDYIAYADNAKSNFAKIIKGLGVIGAIGAAPFTGGATALLAPPLLSSIQNGPPKEIPLKGGIKVNSKGEVSGKIDLNYEGKSGLYFINILAELPGVNFPIVISRRTVRVNSPLQPIADSTML
ncbi:MAG: hypothetical protein HY094_07075 [Candidatus Melainabacteria bacterium]|nr:hypothetical protein [Candidatus Melainabacteria bacterium]